MENYIPPHNLLSRHTVVKSKICKLKYKAFETWTKAFSSHDSCNEMWNTPVRDMMVKWLPSCVSPWALQYLKVALLLPILQIPTKKKCFWMNWTVEICSLRAHRQSCGFQANYKFLLRVGDLHWIKTTWCFNYEFLTVALSGWILGKISPQEEW